MDKNTGGAKPKTGTSSTGHNSNSNNSTARTIGVGSSSLMNRSQQRNRSPRRDPTSRNNLSLLRSLRSTRASNSTSQSPSRRASVPNPVARGRTSGSNTRHTGLQLRGDAHPSSLPSMDQRAPGATSSFSRPVIRQRPAGDPVTISPETDDEGNDDLRSPLRPLAPSMPLPSLPPSSSLFQQLLNSTSDDSDSDPYSPDSLSDRGSSFPAPPALSASPMDQMSPPGPARAPSMSRDALLARELLHDELDDMIQRDEEMARQLQDEINRESDSPPLTSYMPGGLMRTRHFPSVPTRHDAGRLGPRSRERRAPGLSLSRGTDGAFRFGFGPRALGWLMRGSGARRAAGADDDDGVAASGPLAADEERPDELDSRLFPDVLDSSDDVFSLINDPSLMLLMFLLRAPDTLYHNEAGVDLDDYDGLWELAERLGEVRHRGISDDQINQIPTLKFKTQDEDDEEAAAFASSELPQCQICLVDFENGDCLRSIPCRHDFHKDCIDTWLKRNATCPICRQDIKPQA